MIGWLAAHGQVLVLFLFLGMFVGFGMWALWPSNGKKFQRYADIPLRESHDGE